MAKTTIAARNEECKEGFCSKLTEHEIALIAELAESGMTYQEIAARIAA